jgi:hypothetical protein
MRAVAALCLLAACAGPKHPPAAAPPDAPLAAAPVPPPQTANTSLPIATGDPNARRDALTPDEAKMREKVLALLDDGKLSEGQRTLSDLLERHPSNTSLRALYDGLLPIVKSAQKGASASLANVQPVRVERPPFQYTLRAQARLHDAGPTPKLVKVSEQKNKITDNADWYANNKLVSPALAIPSDRAREAEPLPEWMPTAYGRATLVHAIDHGDHVILIFGVANEGSVMAVFDPDHRLVNLFDFGQWLMPSGITPVFGGSRTTEAEYVHEAVFWGFVKDGVLFVANGHRTYAKASNGENAYITALDVRSGQLLWRSAPLVANASAFVYRKGHILTGYGFTAEPDFLYTLDAQTGKTEGKIPVKSGPEDILEKDGKLFVRCYDTDYVFDLR